MILWKDHDAADGKTYSLGHLHPFAFDHVLSAKGNLPAVTVKVCVYFGLHTFTRKVMGDSHPKDDYSDNRETRCFCYERYAQSHRLPTIVRELPSTRDIFLSRGLKGIVNYATFDSGSGGPIYGVYFEMRLFKAAGPNSVLLNIVSAYELEPNKRDTTEGRITFNAVISHAISGTKPKLPARSR